MKRLLIAALLALGLVAPTWASTLYFSDCGYDPANPLANNIKAATGDACDTTGDGVGAYAGCNVCIAPSAGTFGATFPLGFCGTSIPPLGDYGTNGFTPGGNTTLTHAQKVQDYPTDSDTTYLSPNNNGDEETFTLDLSGMPASSVTPAIQAITVYWILKGTNAGNTIIEGGLALGGTEYYGGQQTDGNVGYTLGYTTFTTRPDNGQPWSYGDLAAIQYLAFQAVTVPAGNPKARLSSFGAFVSYVGAPQVGAVAGAPTAGTIGNPWCLDPSNEGVMTSFGQAFDGTSSATNPEATNGDTIYLCAGACDGIGSATYYLQPHALAVANACSSSTGDYHYLTDARYDTITIAGYPGETIKLSSDANNDGRAEAGEGMCLTTQHIHTGHTGWTLKNFTVDRWTGEDAAGTGEGPVFYINDDPNGWTFDGVNATRIGGRMWGGADMVNTTCDNQVNTYVYKVASLTGTLTIKNGIYKDICGFAHRNTVNTDAGAVFAIGPNYYENVAQVSNDFQGHNVTYTGNVVQDCLDGLGIEEQMYNVTVTGNTFACTGKRREDSSGRCYDAINWNDGNNGAGGTGAHDVTISKNKIYSAVAGQYAGAATGWYLQPITVTATSDVALNATIENNIIYRQWPWTGGPQYNVPAIYVKTNRSEVTIQNNTMYDTNGGITLDGTASGKDYAVKNNLIIRTRDGGSAQQNIYVAANAVNSHITFNQVYPSTGAAGVVATVSGIGNVACNSASIATLGGMTNAANNTCATAMFKACDDLAFCATNVGGGSFATMSLWDMQLAGAQAAIDTGTTGSTDDADGLTRAYGSATDIGAFEWYPLGVAFQPPPPIPSR